MALINAVIMNEENTLIRANKKDLHKKRLKAIRFVCTSLKIFKIYYAYSVVCTKVYTSAVVLINVHLRIYISIVILTHLEVFVNTFLGTYECLYYMVSKIRHTHGRRKN